MRDGAARERVAAVAWKLRPAQRDSHYFGHFHDLISAAHDEGASVVVLPEMHCLELLPIVPDLAVTKAAKYLVQYGQAIEEWIGRISASSGMIVVGGSHFRQTEHGIVNACATGIPGQGVLINEKNTLTAYERRAWRLAPGRGLALLPRGLGVTVGYDCEFPGSARALAEAGTWILSVPAFSRTRRAFQTARWSCLARAIENQVFVVHTSLLGSLGREPVLATAGSSAILAPCVEPFPEDSILRETVYGEEGIVVADLSWESLAKARMNKLASNWADRDAGDWTVMRRSSVVAQPDPAHGPNADGQLN